MNCNNRKKVISNILKNSPVPLSRREILRRAKAEGHCIWESEATTTLKSMRDAGLILLHGEKRGSTWEWADNNKPTLHNRDYVQIPRETLKELFSAVQKLLDCF